MREQLIYRNGHWNVATIFADKRKKSKLGESLQTLLGTFGKKKGDKLKRALNEACALDPDTHAAGLFSHSFIHCCLCIADCNKEIYCIYPFL